jgi:hypothetical protein
MARLQPNEEAHLRTLTLGFDADDMKLLYKDVHRKRVIELVETAWEIKERRSVGGNTQEGGSQMVQARHLGQRTAAGITSIERAQASTSQGWS